MSHKLQIVVPDPIAVQLRELSAQTGEPPSTLAGHMVRAGVAKAAKDGAVPAVAVAPASTVHAGAMRARWLEPYGGDPSWREEMWGAIVALHGRYGRLLEHVKDRWWADEAHTETLCALAAWRADIDDGGLDPREELAFQGQLLEYARALRDQGGGVAKAWKPGAPPAEWAAR